MSPITARNKYTRKIFCLRTRVSCAHQLSMAMGLPASGHFLRSSPVGQPLRPVLLAEHSGSIIAPCGSRSRMRWGSESLKLR